MNYLYIVGMLKTSDTSWLTPFPINPLNNGQYVNNGGNKIGLVIRNCINPPIYGP